MLLSIKTAKELRMFYGHPLKYLFYSIFLKSILKRQREYIIYENFNCLPITIHEIQADVRRTDRRMDTVLVIGTVLSFGHGTQKKTSKLLTPFSS